MSDNSDWPREVRQIGVADLKRLGIDAGNRLYWDGTRIEVRQRLDLTFWQRWLAVAVSFFAILGSIGGFASGLNNASAFLCGRGYHWLGCPGAAASPTIGQPAEPARLH